MDFVASCIPPVLLFGCWGPAVPGGRARRAHAPGEPLKLGRLRRPPSAHYDCPRCVPDRRRQVNDKLRAHLNAPERFEERDFTFGEWKRQGQYEEDIAE